MEAVNITGDKADLIKMMIQKGALLEGTPMRGSLLEHAVYAGDEETIIILLKYGAKVSIKRNNYHF